jgi:hypothetical protein
MLEKRPHRVIPNVPIVKGFMRSASSRSRAGAPATLGGKLVRKAQEKPSVRKFCDNDAETIPSDIQWVTSQDERIFQAFSDYGSFDRFKFMRGYFEAKRFDFTRWLNLRDLRWGSRIWVDVNDCTGG